MYTSFLCILSILVLNPTEGYICHGIRAYDRRRNYREKAQIASRLEKKNLVPNCVPAETRKIFVSELLTCGNKIITSPNCLPAERRKTTISELLTCGNEVGFFLLDQDFRATRSETGFLFFSALLACGNLLLDRNRNIILLHFRATSCGNAILFYLHT